MKNLLIAAAALVAIETAAIACSCIDTDDPVELRTFALDAARNAVAVVEVETVLSYQESNGAGDRMRVVRTIAGDATDEFRVQRRGFPSGASCDLLFEKGQRDVVILYPAERSSGGEQTYSISGLCTAHLLDKPVFLDAVAKRIRQEQTPGERG